jgi:hypothetical protein
MTERKTTRKIEQKERQNFMCIAYEMAFQAKHHYDNLSWLICGTIFILFGAAIVYLPQIKGSDYIFTIFKRLLIASFPLLMLWFFSRIYERNRFWAEVANATIQDFENEFGIRGVGIAFMKAHLSGKIELKNMDITGKQIAEPYPDECKAKSMHKYIPWIIKITGVILIVICLLYDIVPNLPD